MCMTNMEILIRHVFFVVVVEKDIFIITSIISVKNNKKIPAA